MQKKSNKNTRSCPRGPYSKAWVRVPVPPEVEKWQRGGAAREPYRQCSQEKARIITGKSLYTVRRWANERQAIDVTSLRLLQIWIWGIIPAAGFIDRGIFVRVNDRHCLDAEKRPQDTLITDNGYTIPAADLESYGWLKTFYAGEVQAYIKAMANHPPAPTAQIIPFAEYLALARAKSKAPDQA